MKCPQETLIDMYNRTWVWSLDWTKLIYHS